MSRVSVAGGARQQRARARPERGQAVSPHLSREPRATLTRSGLPWTTGRTVQPLIPYFPPVKFQITDDFAIHGFGIMVAVAFIVGSHMAMRKAARDGLDPELINRLVGWLVLAVFVGGHLGHVILYEPQRYIDNPIEIFKVWDGLSSFGGFVGCLLITIWFFGREGKKRAVENKQREAAGLAPYPPIRFWDYGECCAYGWAFGWIFARTGCFMAHDHPGLVTDFALGVRGICEAAPGDTTMACHDLGLYEAIWAVPMSAFFFITDRKPRFSGFFMGFWCLFYGAARMWYDGLRTHDTRWLEGVLGTQGVTPGQVMSAAMMLLGVYVLVTRRDTLSAREKYVDKGYADPVADRMAARKQTAGA